MTMNDKIHLIVGLGNPGEEYANTYHNAGMVALGAMATSFFPDGAPRWETHKKLFAHARAGNWILVQPLTFMNVSGAAVREAARKFSVPPEQVIVLHDDSDLPLGEWKIARARGAAGHHGVESVIAALGTNDFTRVRIGIRPPHETTRKKAEEFVLKPITKGAAVTLQKVVGAITEKLQSIS